MVEEAQDQPRWVADPNEVERVIKSLAAPAEDISISESQIQADKRDDYFICCICNDIVIEPDMCVECENLICRRCITPWLQK